MAEIEITGVRKDHGDHYNRHDAVTHYRWIQHGEDSGAITRRETVVGWLEGGLGFEVEAYVEQESPRAYCYVNQSAAGTKFLETRADSTSKNNLLNLPEC